MTCTACKYWQSTECYLFFVISHKTNTKRYKDLAQVAGHGAQGIVFVASVPAENDSSREETSALVVKIMAKTQDNLREIEHSCKVDELLAIKLRAFTRTYGWVACGTVPIVWIDALEEYVQMLQRLHKPIPAYYPMKGESLYLVSEFGGISLLQFVFLEIHEFKGFIFELFYALYEAYNMHQFTHGDLFIGNVLVQRRPKQKTPHVVGYDAVQFKINGIWYPTIIDFGKAQFNDTSVNNMYDVNHFLNSLPVLFSKYDASLVDFMKNVLIKTARKYNNLENLLLDDMFNDFRIRKDKRHAPSIIECHVCRKENVGFRIMTAPSFGVCGKTCLKRLGPIGNIIK